MQFLQEPLVDFSQLMYLVNGITSPESLTDNEDTTIGRFSQSLINIWKNQFLIFYKAMHALSDHTKSFLNGFFKSTSDSHDFTN